MAFYWQLKRQDLAPWILLYEYPSLWGTSKHGCLALPRMLLAACRVRPLGFIHTAWILLLVRSVGKHREHD